jgi:hypothetical protein
MEISTKKNELALNRPSSFLGVIQILQRAFRWLVGLVILSKEDKLKAGIYLGGEGRDE